LPFVILAIYYKGWADLALTGALGRNFSYHRATNHGTAFKVPGIAIQIVAWKARESVCPDF
jgi:hypothetical protein